MRQSCVVASATSCPLGKCSNLIGRRSFLSATIIAPFASLISRPPAVASPELPPPTTAPRTRHFALTFDYRSASRNVTTELRSVQVSVNIQIPTTRSKGTEDSGLPVVIFTPGFLQSATSYGTFLSALVDAGIAVVTYDKSFESLSVLVDDVDSVRLLRQVVEKAEAQMKDMPIGPFFFAGHSRGAKLSVLAAAPVSATVATAMMTTTTLMGTKGTKIGGPQVEAAAIAVSKETTATVEKATSIANAAGNNTSLPQQHHYHQQQHLRSVYGIILLDPADGSFEPQDPDRYPSAVSVIRSQRTNGDLPPVLIVGAGRGGDCVPRAKNYEAFFNACRGPCVLVTLKDAGHLQFLDRSETLQQSICATGRGVSNTRVASVSGMLTAVVISNSIAAAAAASALAASSPSDPGGGGGGITTAHGDVGAYSNGGGYTGPLERLYEERLHGEGLRYEVRFSRGVF